MGAAVWALAILLGPLFASAGPLALALLVGGGAAAYGALGALLGAFRLSDFRAAVRRG